MNPLIQAVIYHSDRRKGGALSREARAYVKAAGGYHRTSDLGHIELGPRVWIPFKFGDNPEYWRWHR